MLKLKQLLGFFDGTIGVTGFTTSSSSSTDVTAAITAVLATAAKDGSSVPLQVASGDTEGVVTSSIVEIFDSATKDKILADNDGAEVYGKITESSGVYTLSYFFIDVNGVEQTYTMTGQVIDFGVQYRFSMANLPYDFALSQNVAQDANGGNPGNIIVETLIPTALNTIPNMTSIPVGFEIKTAIYATVNGHDQLGEGLSVSAGGAVTAVPATIGYSIETSDIVRVSAVIGLV